MSGKRIVLTADRSLMTNYRGNFLYGFIACGPYEVLPEWVFDKVFCPAVETDPTTGEAKVAQVGLRRIEYCYKVMILDRFVTSQKSNLCHSLSLPL